MKADHRKKKVFKLSPRNRASILRVLDIIEKGKPGVIYHVDLFNTGFVVNSLQVKNRIIKLLKQIINNKLL